MDSVPPSHTDTLNAAVQLLSAPVLQLYPAGAAVGPTVGAAVVGARVDAAVAARVGETVA